MITYRIKRKNFAMVPQDNSQTNQDELPSPKDLMSENMKMQRQIMMNTRLKEKIQQDQRQAAIKQQQDLQRMQEKKDQDDNNNAVKTEKASDSMEKPNIISSYHKNTTPNKPISMK